jgi:hypothetical protein
MLPVGLIFIVAFAPSGTTSENLFGSILLK